MTTLSPTRAAELIKQHGLFGATAEATYRYLTGVSPTQADAARSVDVCPSVVSRAVAKMVKETTCPCCGQIVKEIS